MKRKIFVMILTLAVTAAMLFSCAPRAAINARNEALKTSNVAKEKAGEQRAGIQAANEKKARMENTVGNLKEQESAFDEKQGIRPSNKAIADAGKKEGAEIVGSLKSVDEAKKVFESTGDLVFEY